MYFDEEFNTPNCPEESYTGHEYEPPRDPDYVSKKKKGLFRFAKGALAFQVGAAAVVLSVVSSESFAKDALDPSRFIIVSDILQEEKEPLIVVSDTGDETVIVDASSDIEDTTDDAYTPEPTDDGNIDVIEAIDDLVKPAVDNKDKTPAVTPSKPATITKDVKPVSTDTRSITFEECPTCHGVGAFCEECGGLGWVYCTACNNGIETCVVCHGSGWHVCYGCDGVGLTWCRVCNKTGISPYDGGPCPSCNGTGYEGTCNHCGGTGRETCEECGGKGSYLCPHCHGDPKSVTHTCMTCGGNPKPCPDCNGTGKKKVITTISPANEEVSNTGESISTFLKPTGALKKVTCPDCNGTGILCPGDPNFGYDRGNGAGYAGCGGTGYSACPDSRCHGNGIPCEGCGGTGKESGEKCSLCNGTGITVCEFCGDTGIASCICADSHTTCMNCNGTGYIEVSAAEGTK